MPGGWQEYATDRQREILEGWEKYGSTRALQEATGWNNANRAKSSVLTRMRLAGANKDEQKAGIAKSPYIVKGTSTLTGKDGELKLTWTKTQLDREQHIQAFREAFLDAIDDIKPALLIPPPKAVPSKTLSLYPIADLHLGARMYASETGTNWDANKAAESLKQLILSAVESAPASETAIIAQLGDYFDADNAKNRTNESGHVLHGDSNRLDIIRLGHTTLIFTIEQALKKHQHIKVVLKPGNHDEETVLALMLMLEQYYKDEPRVEIIVDDLYVTPIVYHANLLLFFHGHAGKAEDVPLMMAQDNRKVWGETLYTFAHSGHFHKEVLIDKFGVIIEKHSALTPSSKWAHQRFRSLRRFHRIDYDAELGEIGRNTQNLAAYGI